jgi:hypothetical protein
MLLNHIVTKHITNEKERTNQVMYMNTMLQGSPSIYKFISKWRNTVDE